MDDLREALVRTHGALNDLLALWIAEDVLDLGAVDRSLDALAANCRLVPGLPVTASFAGEVFRRAGLAGGSHPPEGRR